MGSFVFRFEGPRLVSPILPYPLIMGFFPECDIMVVTSSFAILSVEGTFKLGILKAVVVLILLLGFLLLFGLEGSVVLLHAEWVGKASTIT